LPTSTPIPFPTRAAPSDLDALFEKYGNQYHVDKELLKKIARCESNFDPNATNKDYAGLFQFASFAWVEARGRMGLNDDLNLRFNAEEAIRTAAFEINYKGTSGWSDCD
jgi:soluble lytic murein transglycosylase-like protein